LLNALQATKQGGVVVRWSAGKEKSTRHWLLSIGDTGPGFALQSAGPLRHALKRATDVAREAKTGAEDRSDEPAATQGSDVLAAGSGSESATLPSGEGIGLSIVKRLCELLGATLELETARGYGTTIRISFPLRYQEPASDPDSPRS
jgi:signal transduction histidine kinase